MVASVSAAVQVALTVTSKSLSDRICVTQAIS
jgi:hypothetical protein